MDYVVIDEKIGSSANSCTELPGFEEITDINDCLGAQVNGAYTVHSPSQGGNLSSPATDAIGLFRTGGYDNTWFTYNTNQDVFATYPSNNDMVARCTWQINVDAEFGHGYQQYIRDDI